MEIVANEKPVWQFPQSSQKQEEIEIKNLEEFVQPFLQDNEYVKHLLSNFYKPTIFSGSAMLEVEIHVKDVREREDQMYYFAKPVRPKDPVWQMFDFKESFRGEVALYKVIIPKLTIFAFNRTGETIIDTFVRFVGARLSLDPKSDVVDRDAVLFLQDPRGKSNIYFERYSFRGYNLETTQFILTKMAELHATAVCYKLLKPDSFKNKILPNLKKENPLPLNKDFLEVVRKRTLQACWRNPFCRPYLAKIEEALDIEVLPPIHCAEPYATLVLNDFWMNNMWIKEKNYVTKKMTILGGQSIQYGSPGHDFMFFMYTSVSLSILENKFHTLVTHYHNDFWHTVKKLRCGTQLFERSGFMTECLFAMKKRELARLLIMLCVMFTAPEKVAKLTDFNIETYLGGRLHPNYYDRIPFLVLNFVKHGYI